VTASRVALDGALARTLGEVLQQFDRLVAQADVLQDTLRGWGLDDAAVAAVTQHLGAHAPDLAAMRGALPRIVAQLGTASFDAPRLVLDVAGAWRGLDALVISAPSLSPAVGVPAFNVLDRLLARVLDDVLRARAPLAWGFGVSLGLLGTGSAPFAVIGQALDHPLQFALARLLAQRRELQIRLAGLLTGPRTTAWAVTDLGDGLPVTPEVRAAVPGASLVAQRLALSFAADTFGEGWPVTLDVLVDGASAYQGLALTAGPLVGGPLRLGRHLSLALTPLDQPMSVVLTGDGRMRGLLPWTCRPGSTRPRLPRSRSAPRAARTSCWRRRNCSCAWPMAPGRCAVASSSSRW
jgi:hypothetical protein